MNNFERHQAIFKKLLSDSDLRDMAEKYESKKKDTITHKINVFRMISEHYYYENRHSDIIKTFLDPSGMHYEGSKFLDLFIDFINERLKGENKRVDKENYKDAIVTREELTDEGRRIDILIKSRDTKHCIIIENKMNNAGDMHNQLPSYNGHMKNHGYTVDCIVYLPLKYKEPDTKNNKEIKDKLCIIPALDLANGWVKPCANATKDRDCASILRQYEELIITLSEEFMDNEALKEFGEYLINNNCIETAIYVGDMVNKIPIYMKNNIKQMLEKLLQDGFFKIYEWEPDKKPSNYCGVMYEYVEEKDARRDVTQYKVDVVSEIARDNDGNYQLRYRVLVYGQINNSIRFNDFTFSMDTLKGFESIDKRMQKIYTWGNEKDLINQVEEILNEMKREVLPTTCR